MLFNFLTINHLAHVFYITIVLFAIYNMQMCSILIS
nr:MAG TPA: hypothetical protein [Caudoviricetes sp.]